jgi:hypothetical protein
MKAVNAAPYVAPSLEVSGGWIDCRDLGHVFEHTKGRCRIRHRINRNEGRSVRN